MNKILVVDHCMSGNKFESLIIFLEYFKHGAKQDNMLSRKLYFYHFYFNKHKYVYLKRTGKNYEKK